MITSTFCQDFFTGKSGLRCVGDVHGDPTFAKVVSDARKDNRAILQMGDIVDRGPAVADAIRTLIDIIDAGDGAVVPGNHDWRYVRYLRGNDVKITHGLGGTIEQIDREPDAQVLRDRFVEIISSANLWQRHGNHLFAHGGGSPSMLDAMPYSLSTPGSGKSYLTARALYGETDGTTTPDGYPNRTFNWLDAMPDEVTMVIGHDQREPGFTMTGAKGATLVFTDTGAGKDGFLSYYDIPADMLS